MKLQYEVGDLLAADIPAIAHGCNCQGVMGAGIAQQIRAEWPDMYKHYRALCQAQKLHPGDLLPWADSMIVHDHIQWVYNLMTQNQPGRDATVGALVKSSLAMIEHATSYDIRIIGLPLIGCGIGGLDWKRQVQPALETIQATSDYVQLVIYTLHEMR